MAPYKIASRETKTEPTVIKAGSFTVGGKQIGVIAGPCSVENEEQIVATAVAVKEAGATALRGGAFKPRTSPYAFQGSWPVGLEMLAAARDKTGLAIVTEVLATEDVPMVAEYADVLQIGARNMQNYRLLEAVGKTKRAVLLKRGAGATLEELLLAAEYVLDAGNPNVILCERGIRTFESHTRYTLPLAMSPYLHSKTHLPVVVDPSHGTGKRDLVVARCRQRRRRGRRSDYRSPSRSGKRHERRLPVARSRRIPQNDGPSAAKWPKPLADRCESSGWTAEMCESLRHRWVHLAGNLGEEPISAGRAFADILQHYAEPGRSIIRLITSKRCSKSSIG